VKIAATVVFVASLAGCAHTPDPVLELAEKSSANVGVVSARLRQLSDESDALFAQRAANVARLHSVNAVQRANLQYDMALTRKVGQEADLALMKDLQSWVEEVDKTLATAAGAERSRREELAAAQVKLDTKAKALQKVADVLTTLSHNESTSERVKLIKAFASEVRDDVKKQLDDGSASSNEAKALLDHLKASVTPVAPH